MTKFTLALIRFYQKTLSPDHGLLRSLFPYGYCQYHPSCSDYARQSLEVYGFWTALPKIILRLLRCNPWSGGGFDPVIKP